MIVVIVRLLSFYQVQKCMHQLPVRGLLVEKTTCDMTSQLPKPTSTLCGDIGVGNVGLGQIHAIHYHSCRLVLEWP